MAAYAGITLLYPGTPLDSLWALNKRGHEGLSAFGRLAAIPFVILSPVLALAALGWFRRRHWAWLLGTAIIAVNMAGDVAQIFLGRRWEGATGVIIAGMLLAYMTRRPVRSYFLAKRIVIPSGTSDLQ